MCIQHSIVLLQMLALIWLATDTYVTYTGICKPSQENLHNTDFNKLLLNFTFSHHAFFMEGTFLCKFFQRKLHIYVYAHMHLYPLSNFYLKESFEKYVFHTVCIYHCTQVWISKWTLIFRDLKLWSTHFSLLTYL